jgi:hypothetical protein
LAFIFSLLILYLNDDEWRDDTDGDGDGITEVHAISDKELRFNPFTKFSF